MGKFLITQEQYFALPHMSNSGLSRIKGEFVPNYFKGSEEAFSFGKLFDCLLTQPDKADTTHEKYELALQMVKTYRKWNMAPIFDKFESQIAWVEQTEFGMVGKCLFDRWKEGRAADFKTVAAATPQAWARTIDAFDYDRQAAWYMEVGGIDEFWLIGFCKTKPWQEPFTTCIRRGDDIWRTGREKIRVILDYEGKKQQQ